MSLKEELAAQPAGHLDLSGFCVVAPETSVRKTIATMREAGRRVCLVMAGEDLVGVFSERDVVRRVVANPKSLARPVSEFMSTDPVTIRPDTSAAEALSAMEEHNIRNLPAVDAQGKVAGTMTHLSIIRYLAARYPKEVLNLPPRYSQFPRKAEGG